MQDRISQYTFVDGGMQAVRYAMYDDGQIYQGNVYLALNDEPQAGDEGTPLSKSTLLDSDTAAAFDLPDASATVNQALRIAVSWRLLASYTAGGAISPYSVPSWVKQIGIFIIGGGASGAARSNTASFPASYKPLGGSGECNWAIYDISGATTINGTVGGGGAAAFAAANTTTAVNDGTATTVTVGSNPTLTANGGAAMANGTTGFPMRVSSRCLAFNPFDLKKCLLDSQPYNVAVGTDDYGNSGSASVSLTSAPFTDVVATAGTAYGCGGGSAYVSSPSNTATSAAGAPGAILIFGR